jgi:hypothetical protein
MVPGTGDQVLSFAPEHPFVEGCSSVGAHVVEGKNLTLDLGQSDLVLSVTAADHPTFGDLIESS